MNVSISKRKNNGSWVWAGDGRIVTNRIEDCAADIGDEAYGALEGAIEYDIDGAAVRGEYVCEVNGVEWLAKVSAPAKRYRMNIDGGNGGEQTVVADSLADAVAESCEWAADGDWSECAPEGATITVRVWDAAGGLSGDAYLSGFDFEEFSMHVGATA